MQKIMHSTFQYNIYNIIYIYIYIIHQSIHLTLSHSLLKTERQSSIVRWLHPHEMWNPPGLGLVLQKAPICAKEIQYDISINCNFYIYVCCVFYCVLIQLSGWWFGTWNLWLSHHIGNVIIPTVTHSIIFQRGRSTTNIHQPVMV